MLQSLFVVIATATLSSAITLLCTWWWWRHTWRREMDRRLRELHDDIGRTVETRTRKAVADAIADINAGDVLRDATWKAARQGSDMLSEGITAILSRGKKAVGRTEEK